MPLRHGREGKPGQRKFVSGSALAAGIYRESLAASAKTTGSRAAIMGNASKVALSRFARVEREHLSFQFCGLVQSLPFPCRFRSANQRIRPKKLAVAAIPSRSTLLTAQARLR